MKPSKREKLDEIRRKIAKTTTPILLDRCKDTLNRFLYDEMKSGSIMMSQQRAEEVVFILDKLKNLEVYPDLLNEIVQEDPSPSQSLASNTGLQNSGASQSKLECLKGTKGHLFYFIPIFAEFITSHEEMIKEALKDIFLEIARSNGVHSNLSLTATQI